MGEALVGLGHLGRSYQRATSRAERDGLVRQSLEGGLNGQLAPSCGLWRLASRLSTCAREQHHPHEDEAGAFARACLNFACLLLPGHAVSDGSAAEAEVATAVAADQALAAIDRRLVQADALVQQGRPADGRLALAMAMELATQVHHGSPRAVGPGPDAAFSQAFRALFWSEAHRLRVQLARVSHGSDEARAREALAASTRLDADAERFALARDFATGAMVVDSRAQEAENADLAHTIVQTTSGDGAVSARAAKVLSEEGEVKWSTVVDGARKWDMGRASPRSPLSPIVEGSAMQPTDRAMSAQTSPLRTGMRHRGTVPLPPEEPPSRAGSTSGDWSVGDGQGGASPTSEEVPLRRSSLRAHERRLQRALTAPTEPLPPLPAAAAAPAGDATAASLRHAEHLARQSVSSWDSQDGSAGSPAASEGSDDSRHLLDETLRALGLITPPERQEATLATDSGRYDASRPGRGVRTSSADATARKAQPQAGPALRPIAGVMSPDVRMQLAVRPAASGAAQGFEANAMPDNGAPAADRPRAANANASFEPGAMYDNAAGTRPKQAADAAGFQPGAMFDNAAATKQKQQPAAAAGFQPGAMFDNAAATKQKQPAAAAGFQPGAMFDNAAATKQKQQPAAAASFEPGAMFDNAAAAKQKQPAAAAGFEPGAMPDNAAAARVRQAAGPAAASEPVQLMPLAMPAGVGTMLAAVPSQPAAAAPAPAGAEPGGKAHRRSMFSAGLMPAPAQSAPMAPVPSLPATATDPLQTMPSDWRSVFGPEVRAAVDALGASPSFDDLVRALSARRFDAALAHSLAAHARLTEASGPSAWARGVMRSFYRSFFVGLLPDALNYRLRADWSRQAIDTLKPNVQFLQHVATFLRSRHGLADGWQELQPFVHWQPDWPTLQAGQAIVLACRAQKNAAGAAAARAVRTQLQLRGPLERFEVRAGGVLESEHDASAEADAGSTLFVAIDDALAAIEGQASRPLEVAITGGAYTRLTAQTRSAMEAFFNDMEWVLERAARTLAAGRPLAADDLQLLSQVDAAQSIELALDQIQASLSTSRPA